MAKRIGWYLPEQLILKITLAGSEPEIWRRVEVHSGLTLHELHVVVQCVFMWDDSHMHQFLVPPGGKLTRKAMGEAIVYQMQPFESFPGMETEGRRTDEEIVGRVLTKECKQIVYEYDFGDSWEHVITLEKRTAGGDHDHVPVCLAGENAAPSDDMGGIWGYYRWLKAAKDESDEMHEEAVGWLGEDFDPGAFDIALANKRLAAAFKPVPRKPKKKRK